MSVINVTLGVTKLLLHLREYKKPKDSNSVRTLRKPVGTYGPETWADVQQLQSRKKQKYMVYLKAQKHRKLEGSRGSYGSPSVVEYIDREANCLGGIRVTKRKRSQRSTMLDARPPGAIGIKWDDGVLERTCRKSKTKRGL